MICAACGKENRAGRKFCVECGAALALACPRCDIACEPGEKFCGDCGADLQTAGAAAAPRSAAPAPPSSARKVVSIVFADLAGSTALHERLDPESVRRFMAAFYEAIRGAIAAHGGTLVKLLGDGVMAPSASRRWPRTTPCAPCTPPSPCRRPSPRWPPNRARRLASSACASPSIRVK